MALVYAVAAFCELLMPYQMGVIVSQGIKAGNQEVIKESGIIMAVLGVAALVVSSLIVRINSRLATSTERELRTKLFKKINELTFEEFSSVGTSGLLTRVDSDIGSLAGFASSGVFALLNVPITFIGGVLLIMSKDALIGIVMLCVSPIVLIFACLLAKRLDYLWDRGEKLTDEQNRLVRERLSGIRVLRAFDKEQEKHEKTKKATKEMVLSYIKANVLSGFINPVATLLLNLATVVIIAISANRISYQSALTAGDIISGVQYIAIILNGLLTLSWTITWLPQVGVATKRINEVLQLKGGSQGKTEEEISSGSISIKDLTFTYPDSKTPTLKNINMQINHGEKIAIIGGTGSGKSTLIKLLLAFYPITSGEITLDNKSYSLGIESSVRKNISVALQKAMIFEGTLKENIACFCNDYSEESILKVISVAQLDGFLKDKGGLEFELKQYGANISGGQKQRINIARTILRPASVFVFDDSFSALDFLTESKLRKELNEYLLGKTQIIVTQRIATAMKCDKIFVMERGEIVGEGVHDQLVKDCEVYSELYRSQIGGGL